MTRTSLSRYPCPVARAADIIGDPWSLLILRDALAGVRRFSDFKTRLGVATNILTARLAALVDHGVLAKRETRPGVQRHDYVLTEKGLDLVPALIALMQWGERWAFEPGESPVTVRVRDTGEALAPLSLRSKSGQAVALSELQMIPTEHAPEVTRQSYAALAAQSSHPAEPDDGPA